MLVLILISLLLNLKKLSASVNKSNLATPLSSPIIIPPSVPPCVCEPIRKNAFDESDCKVNLGEAGCPNFIVVVLPPTNSIPADELLS